MGLGAGGTGSETVSFWRSCDAQIAAGKNSMYAQCGVTAAICGTRGCSTESAICGGPRHSQLLLVPSSAGGPCFSDASGCCCAPRPTCMVAAMPTPVFQQCGTMILKRPAIAYDSC